MHTQHTHALAHCNGGGGAHAAMGSQPTDLCAEDLLAQLRRTALQQRVLLGVQQLHHSSELKP